ncbi:MAG: tetratricopeptide repeat protein [Phycisphaerae bacterium]|nr:tetratricopeptide repeat protein [Phycisphaerae bacterium]
MDRPSPPRQPVRDRKSTTPRVLRVLAAVVALLFVAAGAIRLIQRSVDSVSAGTATIGEFGILLGTGLACGGLLLGLSIVLRLVRDLRDSLIRMEQFQYEQHQHGQSVRPLETDRPTAFTTGPASDPGADESGAPLDGSAQEIVRLLEDIRDNSLLSEAERHEKRQRVAEEEIQEAQGLIRSLTSEGDFVQASQVADKIRRKYPNDKRAVALTNRVETARERRESEDVNAYGRQVDDLISISAWHRAREVAQELQERHPDSAGARQLLFRIERDFRAFQDEQRRRMRAEIQRYVTRRRWREALKAAQIFIERFPNCEESEGLRLELPTLETNAEIEDRQKREAEIMDYAKHGRYMEAVKKAEELIDKYPNSPQAEALRSQLPRLKELANDPKALPARKLSND